MANHHHHRAHKRLHASAKLRAEVAQRAAAELRARPPAVRVPPDHELYEGVAPVVNR